MFIHIGSDKMVLAKDIIMILDKSAIIAKNTLEFLQTAKDRGIVRDSDKHVLEQNIKKGRKTAIVMDKKVLFSPISSKTLSKRVNFIDNFTKKK